MEFLTSSAPGPPPARFFLLPPRLSFLLPNPEAARNFLWKFSRDVRFKGEQFFTSGAVRNLTCLSPAREYAARVQEIMRGHETSLEFGGEEWTAACSCPRKGDCPHTYATMRALVAAHQRELAGSMPEAADSPAPAAVPEPSVLLARVQAAATSPLTAPELDLLDRLSRTFRARASSARISPGDLRQLGFPATGEMEEITLAPAPATDDHQFWLHLAHHATQQGWPLPDFLQPVTRLDSLGPDFHLWHRSHTTARWREQLGALSRTPAPPAPESWELRLRLHLPKARLEGRRADPTAAEPAPFQPIPLPAWQHLRQLDQDGLLRLAPADRVLWQHVRSAERLEGPLLFLDSDDGLLHFSRLLAEELPEPFLVNHAGHPVQRGLPPLAWQLISPEDPAADYQLRLALEDGGDPPDFLLRVPFGRGWLLSSTALHPFPPGPLKPELNARTLRIPTAALETGEGVTLLEKIGLPAPPGLQPRVKKHAFPVTLCGELTTSSRGLELCTLSAIAATADGVLTNQFAGSGWLPRDAVNARAADRVRTADPRAILVYDRSALDAVPAVLTALGTRWDATLRTWTVRVGPDFPEKFSTWLQSIPPSIDVQLRGELASLSRGGEGEISASARLEVTPAELDWFDLKVVLDHADTDLTEAELRLLFEARGSWVRLPRGGWRRIDWQLTANDEENLTRLGLTPGELARAKHRLHALQLADETTTALLPDDAARAILRRVDEIQHRVTPPLPAALRATLRPYQLEGFHFLAYLATNRFGGILADDMGLGKTLQTLAWLAWLRESSPDPASPGPALVICPKSVTDSWRSEAKKFLPGLRARVWKSNDLKVFASEVQFDDLHIINYAQLRTLAPALAGRDFLAVILDEAQAIKNPESQTAKTAASLRATHRLALSGTPIENRLLDLWSIMQFAMPGVLGSRSQFLDLYDPKTDIHALRRLSSRMRPFMLRRTKLQVARDLPERIEEDILCDLEPAQETLYRAELKRAQAHLLRFQKTDRSDPDTTRKERLNVLNSLTRLRQICCHPALVSDDLKTLPSAKLDALRETLDPLIASGNKVLVFSQFVGMLAILRHELKSLKVPLFYLAGETENRGALVEKFQTTTGPAIFLISLRAGGSGLTLTAASTVILFDPWWNPAAEAQAIDRAHRIGQTSTVLACRLLMKDTIEEKIRALQKSKAALADDVLGEERFASALTLGDLDFLFSEPG